jgi:high-affinity nickel-transport protein
MPVELAIIFAAIGGGIGLYTTAVALGIRHGIDWDHIAAITDITSAGATAEDEEESWLLAEPGLQLSDESHHLEHTHDAEIDEHQHAHAHGRPHEHDPGGGGGVATLAPPAVATLGPVAVSRSHVSTFWLGSLYALGHGLVVTVLGVIAILAAEVLPDWVDPIMERLVGITLIFLALYLFYSIYRYFSRGGEFRIRSRWMLVFAGVANAWSWIRSRVGKHEHHHHAMPQTYTGRSAFGIGLIHGIGAETGTQALIIATAVGATSKATAIGTLLFFVVGLLISNSIVTIMSTAGFVSAKKRTAIYITVGFVAAVFSLVLGVLFLLQAGDTLPGLDKYFKWIGGPDTE